MAEERRRAEEKARLQQQREEMQSTASDEGVMVKGSSADELEDRDFPAVERRDSEE